MKNQSANKFSILVKNMVAPAALLFMLVCTSPSTAHAEDKKETKTPIEVKYLGLLNDQPLIQITVDNKLQDDLYIVIKDEAGNTLYSARTKDKSFSKKFQFSDTERNFKLTVSLLLKDEKRVQNFEINNVTTQVEDVVVTEIR